MEEKKLINIALQGGGSHGAFGWGVLDKLIEDGRIDIDGICGTSAGTMNAVIFAYGRMTGGPDGAQELLHNFWHRISQVGKKYSPVQQYPWENHGGGNMDNSPMFMIFDSFTRMMSPYQFNPRNFNPLRSVLEEFIDFDRLHGCKCSKLFVSATNVRTGKVKIFKNEEITLDVMLASACLPYLFQAVEIDGENYWDGGYMGNPALFPLFYHAEARDVVVVHINPVERAELPTKPNAIYNRVNEITFNSSLLKEFRAIAFVNKMLDEGWIKDEYKGNLKHMLVHSIRADKAMCHLSTASKFSTDWSFLQELRDRGRKVAQSWLDKNYEAVNNESTVDLHSEFLDIGSEHAG